MKGLNILMIEDDELDIMLIGDVLKGSGILKSLHVVNNGAQALRFLRNEEQQKDHVLPDLILLDINMPVMDGHETLERIKSDINLKHIPVIMLTTSSSSNDIKKAYQQHCNSYIIKPYSITDLDNMVEAIKHYWHDTVRLNQ